MNPPPVDEFSPLNFYKLTYIDSESSSNESDAAETIGEGGRRNRRKNRRQMKPRYDTEAENEPDKSLEQPIEDQPGQNQNFSQPETNDDEPALQQRVKTSSDSRINHNVRRQKELFHNYNFRKQNPNIRQHQPQNYRHYQKKNFYHQNQTHYDHQGLSHLYGRHQPQFCFHQNHFHYYHLPQPQTYYQHNHLIPFNQHHRQSHGLCNHCNELSTCVPVIFNCLPCCFKCKRNRYQHKK